MSRKKKAPPNRFVPLSLREGLRDCEGTRKPRETGPHTRRQMGYGDQRCICINSECRLRAAGCRGFMGCPGFKGT